VSGPDRCSTYGQKPKPEAGPLAEVGEHRLKELRHSNWEQLSGNVTERAPEMLAEMRNVRCNGVTDEQNREDGQELIEGHTSTLTEDVITPRFA
jgi:hypothetical protein